MDEKWNLSSQTLSMHSIGNAPLANCIVWENTVPFEYVAETTLFNDLNFWVCQ